ncbi:MAG: LysM peptidoglycan-binding domain-containing protein [Bacilli bacterium]|nr:LysM peptidoglycan-binding domain-containing protein [Bacilli bacterium]
MLEEIIDNLNLDIPSNEDAYYDYYTINKGDTLYSISRMYNINPELLASINGLNMSDYIYDGQRIIIPKSNCSYYITAEGDTLNNVAEMFSINKDKLLEENKTIYLLPGQIMVNKVK